MNSHKPRIYLIATRSIKVIISSIYLSTDCIIALAYRLLGIKRKAICIIVCYHTITEEDLAKFKKQINFLMRHTTTIDPSDIHEIECDTRCSVVTFDDGLLSFYRMHLLSLKLTRYQPSISYLQGCWVRDQGGSNLSQPSGTANNFYQTGL